MADRARPGLALTILLVIFASGLALWPRVSVLSSWPPGAGLAPHAVAVRPALVGAVGPVPAEAEAPRGRRHAAGDTTAVTPSVAVFTTPAAWPTAGPAPAAANATGDTTRIDARPTVLLAAYPAAAAAWPAAAPGRGHGFSRAGQALASAFARTGDALAGAFRK